MKISIEINEKVTLCNSSREDEVEIWVKVDENKTSVYKANIHNIKTALKKILAK